jgi:hypothetical protein
MTQLTQQKKTLQERFLDSLAKTGNISAACRASGFPRKSAYRLREEDPDFAAAWEQALEEAVESLEQEAWRRAAKGSLKPVFQGGQEVGQIREYSDTLMIFLLKGHKPDKYRENGRLEVTGKDGGSLFEGVTTALRTAYGDRDTE